MRTTPEKRFSFATSQQRRAYILRRVAAIALAAALVFSIASVRAADNGKWIGTWAASPQPVWDADFLAPINFPRNLWNQTIRQIARVSARRQPGARGALQRIRLAAAGDRGRACRAFRRRRRDQGGIDRALTFSGNASVTIPPGAPAISDPVELSVAAAQQRRGESLPAGGDADDDNALGRPPDRLYRGRRTRSAMPTSSRMPRRCRGCS